MHGGKSTGARTVDGQARCRIAPLKHGQRSAAVVAERRQLTAKLRALHLMAFETRSEVAAYIRQSQSIPPGGLIHGSVASGNASAEDTTNAQYSVAGTVPSDHIEIGDRIGLASR